VQSGILLSVFIENLRLDLQAGNPAELLQLYKGAWQPGTPFGRVVKAVALCQGLASTLPKHILAECWPGDFVTQHAEFLSDWEGMCRWTRSCDEDLGKVLEANSDLKAPLDLESRAFSGFTNLTRLSPRLVWCRIELFRRVTNVFPDLARLSGLGGPNSVIGPVLAASRFAISTKAKIDHVDKLVIDDWNHPSASDRPEVRIIRFSALQYFTSGRGTPLIGQIIEQIPPDSDRVWELHRRGVPWQVELISEGATDAGGPGRVLFSDVAMEFLHPQLHLFVPTPNGRRKSGDNQEFFVPHPDPVEPGSLREKMYVYVGLCLAISHISKLPQPMHFAKLVWKALTDVDLDIEDIFEVDSEFRTVVESEVVVTEQRFETQDSAGGMRELFPGGSSMLVTQDRQAEFVQLCKKFRLKEFASQFRAMKRGLDKFFGPMAARLLSPWELEMLCCGRPEFTIEELKANCTYP
jgi:hypothetical protein